MSANADIMTETLGWAATTVIVGSYFCGRADTLRRVQMAGALMWLLYGLLIEAYPVVVANVLVIAAAAWTITRSRDRAPEVVPGAGGKPAAASVNRAV
jgi:hypothetical protein